MEGVFWWDLQLPVPGSDDQSWVMYGKPAGTIVLPHWFGSAAPGFKLSSSAASLTVAQNGIATDTISVQDEGGFTGSVTLAITGLPSGVTASLGTNPTTGSSVITFKASATATGRAATVTVTGTSGSMTATTAITVDVTTSACNIGYTISDQWQGGFGADVTINNTGTTALTSWTLVWPFANGQTISSFWNGTVTQSGATVTAVNLSGNGNIPAGGSYSSFGFNGTWNNVTNAIPTSFLLNNTSCSINGSGVTPSFTLAPSAANLAVTLGNSATDTITVTDTGGFTGGVSFAATGLPSGVTASFSPTSSTSSSVLTLTASSTATVGLATVTITGTSGSMTAKATIALTVTTSTPSFTLAPSAVTLSVTQGKTATDTITVTDVNGFKGSVTLVATGLPSGVTVAYGTNPTTSTSVLTFTASATATIGTSTVSITGTSGSTTSTAAIALAVAPSGGACTVDYAISPQNSSAFGAAITIVNGPTAITSWTLTWTFANGQTVSDLWNGVETQSGANVTVKNESYNGSIAVGGTLSGIGFNGTWNGTTNAIPTAFSLNGTACTVN
jgi:hypothetical protein